MSDITIEVWDATGNKQQLVQVPADAAINRVIAVLVRKMNLPQYSPDGQLMSYKFQHRGTGRQLLDNETLASAGVRDGDVVRLQPEITAGRVASERWSENARQPLAGSHAPGHRPLTTNHLGRSVET